MQTTTTTTTLRTALYAHVSTTGHGQDAGLQLDELRQVARQRGWNVGAEHVADGVSGATTSRPALERLMEAARRVPPDLVAVWRLDRVGRSLHLLLADLDELQFIGVGFVFIRDAGIDTTSASGRLLLHLLGAFGAFEQGVVKLRVLAGVRRVQAHGKRFGRSRVTLDLRPALAGQGHSKRGTASIVGVSRATLRRRLAEVAQRLFAQDA